MCKTVDKNDGTFVIKDIAHSQGYYTGREAACPPCNSGQSICDNTNYVTCDNNKWNNHGDVNGYCEVNWAIVSFAKKGTDNNATVKDCITSKVCITRGSSQGLFNQVNETKYSTLSPTDTEWYYGSDCNNTTIFDIWTNAVRKICDPLIPANCGANYTANVPACLHLKSDNQYYNIKFGLFANNGDFNYARIRTTPFLWTN